MKACRKNYGLSLEEHRACQLTESDIKEADLILTMTASHKRMLEKYVLPKNYLPLRSIVTERKRTYQTRLE